jgi:N-methylhydantoinase A/oxoprolinase/acetone carboxylase beta subunit
MVKQIRIGIDVGGTFTHAVAVDGETLSLVGKAKVPTTHSAKEGVALGIVNSLQRLLSTAQISPDDVGFIAHSTTQATNALLEGDVASVGVIGMGNGSGAWLSNMSTNVGKIELAPGKFLTTYHRFLNTSKPLTDDEIKKAIDGLLKDGASAIAISEAFSVDEPDNELRALAIAQEMGLYATAGSQVSQLYGLKIRTRTAVINASMLPKMIESADMTERSVREAGIKAPVMIMRSDGGVMDIDSMRKRPILTILSGPAAGVAAAMMYLRISDGIFLEIGGTSTDISAIRNGKALVKSAEIGGHKVYLRTLDVRTVGIAGGSMLRMRDQSLVDVGPRSAHIAGMSYVSFSAPLANPQVHTIQPKPGDPSDYLALSDGASAPSVCLTPTCAANLLKLVPDGDCAQGDAESIATGFKAICQGKSAEQTAAEVLTVSTGKCWPVVRDLMKDYKLDPELTTLVGGGGGAAALVPFLAQHHQMKHSLANNADVISAIGVALALLRETVERQIINPDSEAILRVRQEAHAAVQRMGADPATIEIQVEVDSKTNIVRATACGATRLTNPADLKERLSPEQRRQLVSESMRVETGTVKFTCETEHFQVFEAATIASHLGGLLKSRHRSLRILDETGVIRLQMKHGDARPTTAGSVEKTIAFLVEDYSEYGDAGRIIPSIILLAGPRIIDLSGLPDLTQVLAVAKIELETLPRDAQTIVLASLN